METSTRIINYYLKEPIEGQNSKITLSGRSPQKQKKQGHFWLCFLWFNISKMTIMWTYSPLR